MYGSSREVFQEISNKTQIQKGNTTYRHREEGKTLIHYARRGTVMRDRCNNQSQAGDTRADVADTWRDVSDVKSHRKQ